MRIVFIWVGGIWLSSLAHLMLDCGIDKDNIIWIDSDPEQQTAIWLQTRGISIYTHGQIECLPNDIVLYSDAVLHSPEYQTYHWELGGVYQNIKMYSYFDFLGELSKHFTTITIAWSHGKSTTTAMSISAMYKLVPSFALGIVGTLMKEFNNKNYAINEQHATHIHQIINHIIDPHHNTSSNHAPSPNLYFVVEWDEFNRHFHYLDTDIALITNIDHDHADVYPTTEEYLSAFQDFVDHVTTQIIIHPKDQALLQFPTHTHFAPDRSFQFTQIFGSHNEENASLVYTLLAYIIQDEDHIQTTIEGFQGIRRRQDIIYSWDHGIVISDYAHHPSEIHATFQAVKNHFPNKKIIWIFQPHQAVRVLEFEKEFVRALEGFDERYIFPIYAARENFTELQAHYPQLQQISDFTEYSKQFAWVCHWAYLQDHDQVRETIQQGDIHTVFVVMTAGNLDREVRKRLATIKR